MPLERDSAALPYSRDPHIVSRIDPCMRLLGSVRCRLFHEALFVLAARAYGDVGPQRCLSRLGRFRSAMTPTLSAARLAAGEMRRRNGDGWAWLKLAGVHRRRERDARSVTPPRSCRNLRPSKLAHAAPERAERFLTAFHAMTHRALAQEGRELRRGHIWVPPVRPVKTGTRDLLDHDRMR
jgi:hypothetical protein